MKMIEISMDEYSDLHAKHFEVDRLRKRFLSLEKGEQELLVKLERYERALNQIAWNYAVTSPVSMQMKDVAMKALYNK